MPGDKTLEFSDASRAWDELAQRVEALVTAWEREAEAPDLGRHLPSGPAALRKLTLVELIKVDLEYRNRLARERTDGPTVWRVEDYLRRFPELGDGRGPPCDLIYEEFHVRKQAGEPVLPEEYFGRFPAQAAELGRLLGPGGAAERSIALAGGDRYRRVEVGEQLDEFDLLTRLGQGSFASVFLARQRSMQRLVALKVSGDRGDEPKTMSRLDHPNIVRVYDQRVLEDRGLRLLYMQYVPGGTLESAVELARMLAPEKRTGGLLLEAIDQALEQRGETPPAFSRTRRRLAESTWPEVVCWLGSRLAAALDSAHREGVLHRDLKPANVLLTADANPKLADFNISFCSKVDGASAAAFFGGSLAYMSPEQLTAYHPGHDLPPESLDGRSDTYSLGVMLWELLVGRRPFRDEPLDRDYLQAVDVMIEKRKAGPAEEAWRELPSDLPEGLREILARLLAPAPEDRFSTAGQVSRRLEMCLHPRTRRLASLPRVGWRAWATRHPLAALLAVGLAASAVSSALNIAYNAINIIRPLKEPAERVFRLQLMVVNPIAYSIGCGLVMWMAWPVLRAVARAARTGRQGITGSRVVEPSAPQKSFVRRRAVRLGRFVAWVTAVEWALSGLIFPLWLHAQAESDEQMQFVHYMHFMSSQAVCGLIAATQSFFAVTFLSLRVFLPRLVGLEEVDEETHVELKRLGVVARRQFVLAQLVPLAAIVPMALIDTGREEFLYLAGVGGIAFLVAYRLAGLIHGDIEILAIATAASQEGAPAEERGESFWSNSN